MIACLMIHDYASLGGPIRQKRVRWFVGPQCYRQIERMLAEEPCWAAPNVMVFQGIHGHAIRDGVSAAVGRVETREKELAGQITQHYQAIRREDLVALLGEDPHRVPRALLFTSRFTTVLKYSTADAAEGLRQLGWEVRVLMEEEPYHLLGPRVMRPGAGGIPAGHHPATRPSAPRAWRFVPGESAIPLLGSRTICQT